jgi:hypothetical protein
MPAAQVVGLIVVFVFLFATWLGQERNWNR